MQSLTNKQTEIVNQLYDELLSKIHRIKKNRTALENLFCDIFECDLVLYNKKDKKIYKIIQEYIENFDDSRYGFIRDEVYELSYKNRIDVANDKIQTIDIEKIANKVMDILANENTIVKREFVYAKDEFFQTCHVDDEIPCIEVLYTSCREFCPYTERYEHVHKLDLFEHKTIEAEISEFETKVDESNSYFDSYECIEAILKDNSNLMSINDFDIDDNGVCTYTQSEESLTFLKANY